MNKSDKQYFRKLINSPSPSGYESAAKKVWKERVEPSADEFYNDVLGNSIAVLNPKGKVKVMLSGHIDEIGLIIHFINKEGFLYFKPLGGIETSVLVGQQVNIHTANGVVQGVIGKKAIHLTSAEERKKTPEIDSMWIDIGAKDKEDAEKIVAIGDPATLNHEMIELMGKNISARGFDDKIGAFIVGEVLCKLSKESGLKAAVYSVASVQEEVGLRGARVSAGGIEPDVGIAVDVTFATDSPAAGDVKKKIGEVELGGGPEIIRGINSNHKLFEILRDTAKENKIPLQVVASSRPTGTDGNAIEMTKAGVAATTIGVPLRYMHSPIEVLNLDDVENIIKLMVKAILKIDENTSFIPE